MLMLIGLAVRTICHCKADIFQITVTVSWQAVHEEVKTNWFWHFILTVALTVLALLHWCLQYLDRSMSESMGATGEEHSFMNSYCGMSISSNRVLAFLALLCLCLCSLPFLIFVVTEQALSSELTASVPPSSGCISDFGSGGRTGLGSSSCRPGKQKSGVKLAGTLAAPEDWGILSRSDNTGSGTTGCELANPESSAKSAGGLGTSTPLSSPFSIGTVRDSGDVDLLGDRFFCLSACLRLSSLIWWRLAFLLGDPLLLLLRPLLPRLLLPLATSSSMVGEQALWGGDWPSPSSEVSRWPGFPFKGVCICAEGAGLGNWDTDGLLSVAVAGLQDETCVSDGHGRVLLALRVKRPAIGLLWWELHPDSQSFRSEKKASPVWGLLFSKSGN